MEGWGIPESSRTGHHFTGDWSLCRRVSPPPAMLAAEPPERVCGACREALQVRQAVGSVERRTLD
ncbi:MAG: hypothetical protein ACXWOW_03340 [Candidatus Limnocylindrales bacterium]